MTLHRQERCPGAEILSIRAHRRDAIACIRASRQERIRRLQRRRYPGIQPVGIRQPLLYLGQRGYLIQPLHLCPYIRGHVAEKMDMPVFAMAGRYTATGTA